MQLLNKQSDFFVGPLSQLNSVLPNRNGSTFHRNAFIPEWVRSGGSMFQAPATREFPFVITNQALCMR
jgi:hypothetical protein